MNMLGTFTIGLVVSIVSLGAAAGSLDGSEPLMCASVETHDCQPGDTCIKGLAEDIDAPQFIRLDFERGVARTTRANGEERTAKIQKSTLETGRLILQGVQQGLGWTLTISQLDGTMTLTAVGDGVAFVVFGACTPL